MGKSHLTMKTDKFALFCFLAVLSIQSNSACEPCLENKLTSNGAFAIFYPRFLGTWVYAGDWDRNPFYVCNDCMGLRAFILFLRNSERSNEGHWTITDCHPNDVACGGNAHKLL